MRKCAECGEPTGNDNERFCSDDCEDDYYENELDPDEYEEDEE